ncbi:ribose-phosphate pyrophosphokinase-like domain-containing protein, partial [Candidatus Gottesmanbacteria bacterium]|nr:ribose-phosphate pyrophosphokinase-like domain-containing protein [Candidatus Gottesmanbacteria bacterium]
MKDFLLFSGSSNRPLAEAVVKKLGMTLGNVELTRFADG